jgi:hypothetical protein
MGRHAEFRYFKMAATYCVKAKVKCPPAGKVEMSAFAFGI